MRHVLVVDDDPTIRRLVADVLEDADYRVETAADGAEALAKVRAHPPAMLLLDLMMPVMDGRQSLEACRREAWCEDVPILLMSAGHRASEAEALRAQGFLAKPFDLGDLLGAVERLN
jgi:CheY-like chemotaxis protein